MGTSTAQVLFVAGTIPLIAFGALHALLALRDSVHPRAFAPTERAVVGMMRITGIRLRGADTGAAAKPSMWSVWLGIHIGFGLCLLTVGLLLALVAAHDFSLVERIAGLRPLAIAFAAGCLAVSLRFFFYGPVLISATVTACFTAATVLSA